VSRPSLEKIVVFGATSAMAQETARLLAARGAELFLVGRDPAKLEAILADVRVRGARP
jgi:decaprenylphospho-beta-D-erythro-pentofuranosid-2-ulose 2-reductase